MLPKVLVAITIFGLFLCLFQYSKWEDGPNLTEANYQPENINVLHTSRRLMEEPTPVTSSRHPFLSDTCVDFLTDKELVNSLSYKFSNVFVIVPVHNIEPTLLLASVNHTKSFQSYSYYD